MASESDSQPPAQEPSETPSPTWTYPTRFCRICREDVAPTVTMYPPGVPPRFQKPIVEYKNEDEYGRLVKPCKCTGSMRYIHELCLLRSRTENRRAGSFWKCHTCGHRFNFQKLKFQRFLTSKYSSGALTMLVMLILMFFLGFVADPIINMYVDPYESILGDQDVWDEIKVRTPGTGAASSWAQHFVKGLVSMGLMGFVKMILLNPLNWLNLRHNLGMTSARTTNTGRDRAINISWVAVLIGVVSAFYFFYQWVQTVIEMSLKRIGNNIVDTQLPGDDDDLKPPPGWKEEGKSSKGTTSSTRNDTEGIASQADTFFQKAAEFSRAATSSGAGQRPTHPDEPASRIDDAQPQTAETSTNVLENSPVLIPSWSHVSGESGHSSALDSAHDQGWSFASL